MTDRKRVCIIGSGASGLTSIKACLDEGMQPVCYERADYIGGLWQYNPSQHERACVYKSTVINTSKEMMCFSDFPVPKDFANFMHNTKIIQYFNMYAKEFGLMEHINFNTEVVSCDPCSDHDVTGRWTVRVKDVNNNDIREEIFDGVMVCIGHHAIPNFKKEAFAGLDDFQGEYMHSHDYRTPERFYDKAVMVVGLGNSAGDIAVETSRVANQTYLSTRRGAWILNRVSTGGMPIDIVYTNRFNSNFVFKTMPKALMPLVDTWLENTACGRFNHETYGLKPKHRFTSQHATVNDDLPNRILNGTIKVKGDIRRFTKDGVIFEDGHEAKVDVVFFATGYIYNFPFLDESIVPVSKNQNNLFKYMWPTDLKKNTLAVIGLIQPTGAVNPISEIQARWAARVIKGEQDLPSRSVMKEDIAVTAQNMRERFYKSERHTIQVDYVPFMDDIAQQFGAVPDVKELLKNDILLAWKVLFGPATPYQYRLNGPGSNYKQARKNINNQMTNVLYPLVSTRGLQRGGFGTIQLVAIFLFFIMFYILFLG